MPEVWELLGTRCDRCKRLIEAQEKRTPTLMEMMEAAREMNKIKMRPSIEKIYIENKELHQKIEVLESAAETVEFFVQHMEKGIDARVLYKELLDLKKKYKKLKEKYHIAIYDEDKIKLKNQIAEFHEQMQKQQETVVKPLIEQVIWYKKDQDKRMQN